jgi:hypothetical protein
MAPDETGYSSGAFKRLERTRRKRNDWSAQHYDALLKGFGFRPRTSGKHTFYTHADFPDVYVVFPRSRRLRCYVADQAIDAIEDVLARKGILHDE